MHKHQWKIKTNNCEVCLIQTYEIKYFVIRKRLKAKKVSIMKEKSVQIKKLQGDLGYKNTWTEECVKKETKLLFIMIDFNHDNDYDD